MTTPERIPVDEQVAALRRELKLTWDAHEREHAQHDQAHGREHEFTAEALKVAATLARENKADANEWRGSMNDRERNFATKKDIEVLGDKIDKLEEAEIRRAENERLRIANDAEEKRQNERRQAVETQKSEDRTRSSQWRIALVVGVLVTVGTILINLVTRLALPT